MNEWIYAAGVLTLMAAFCAVFVLCVRLFVAGLCKVVELLKR